MFRASHPRSLGLQIDLNRSEIQCPPLASAFALVIATTLPLAQPASVPGGLDFVGRTDTINGSIPDPGSFTNSTYSITVFSSPKRERHNMALRTLLPALQFQSSTTQNLEQSNVRP
jgi:hypothetical protein